MTKPSPGSVTALATRLTSDNLSGLVDALAIRQPRTVGVRDPFDLADELLAVACIDRGLARFTAGEIQAIGQDKPSDDTRGHLKRLLLGDGLSAYPEVRERARHWAATLPESVGEERELSEPDVRAESEVADVEWSIAEGLIHVALLGDVLRVVERQAIRLARDGTVTKAGAQALEESVPRADVTPQALIDLALATHLLSITGDTLRPGPNVSTWSGLSLFHRWSALCDAIIGTLDHAEATILKASGANVDRIRSRVQATFPLDDSWILPHIERALSAVTVLGLAQTGTLAPPLIAALHSAEAPGIATSFKRQAPVETDTFLIQHDLSIVAPGPLTAEVENRLHAVARIESRGMASTFRLSAETIAFGLSAGETAESLRTFLAQHSQTPVPKNVLYLVDDVATRHGTIRLSRTTTGTSLTTATSGLLDSLLVDVNLSALQLTRTTETAATTRVDAVTVQHIIGDGGYPIPIMDTPPMREPAPASPTVDSTWTSLIERIRGAESHETSGWMARELELAIRAKQRVRVTVVMPDGDREFVLEPASLTNGRLRGRDVRGSVERTLPIEFISAVAPAE